MQTISVSRHGGPDVLEVRDAPTPEPGPDELRVDVAAAGVNFVDVYHRTGTYPTRPPFVPGLEGAGRVSAVGAGVSGVAVGDRVAWAAAPGSYAEQVLVPASAAVPVPDAVPDDLAAALPLQGMTAHYLCRSTYPVAAGDTVLVHAAAGGVGLLLVQLVSGLGGRVLATTSTPQKAELAREAGAVEVLPYQGFSDQVRRLTGGAGCAAVFDGVGAATFDESLASLRPRGMLVLFGAASGQVPPLDLQRLNAGGSLFVTRPTLVHYTATREELLWRAGDLWDQVRAGRLRVRIGARYPLAAAARAHADLEARSTSGKLLLLPSATR
ncbi:MAG: quinone oxidoreductase family protein [Mycobacteriales bacterium]